MVVCFLCGDGISENAVEVETAARGLVEDGRCEIKPLLKSSAVSGLMRVYRCRNEDESKMTALEYKVVILARLIGCSAV